MVEKGAPTQDLLQEMREISEQQDKSNLSKRDYEEKTELRGDPAKRFGTWNKAKKAAGLEPIYERVDLPPEKDIIEVLHEIDEDEELLNTKKNLADKLGCKYQSVPKFNPLCRKADVEPHKKHYTDEEVLQKVKEAIEGEDVVLVRELRQMTNPERLKDFGVDFEEIIEANVERIAEYLAENLSHGHHQLSKINKELEDDLGIHLQGKYSLDDVTEKLEKRQDLNIRTSSPGNKKRKLFVDKGKFDNEHKYKRKMREKWNNLKSNLNAELEEEDELFDIFIEQIGTGITPRIAFCTIAYLETDKTQRQISEEIGGSPIQIRKWYDSFVEEYERFEMPQQATT